MRLFRRHSDHFARKIFIADSCEGWEAPNIATTLVEASMTKGTTARSADTLDIGNGSAAP
ncbi:MAG TPA: hypothetical protein VN310_09265 [Candidatus Dormibacteraeota bacterium]|nr:hypothetical protein [Candidatus Dormibacteraeota bacterium]